MAEPDVIQLSNNAVGDAMNGLRSKKTRARVNITAIPADKKLPTKPIRNKLIRSLFMFEEVNLICLFDFLIFLFLLESLLLFMKVIMRMMKR